MKEKKRTEGRGERTNKQTNKKKKKKKKKRKKCGTAFYDLAKNLLVGR